MSKSKYGDPQWQKMRLRIMERDEFTCQECGATAEMLSKRNEEFHVHHKYYEPGAKKWEYPETALITLCEQCHESHQAAMTYNHKAIASFNPYLAQQFFAALSGYMTDYNPDALIEALTYGLTVTDVVPTLVHCMRGGDDGVRQANKELEAIRDEAVHRDHEMEKGLVL